MDTRAQLSSAGLTWTEARCYLDGEDSREDGTRDSDRPAVVQELEEGFSPEEELSDDKVGSRVHLLLQVAQVLLVALCLRVARRVSWTNTALNLERQGIPGLLPRSSEEAESRTGHTDVKVVIKL